MMLNFNGIRFSLFIVFIIALYQGVSGEWIGFDNRSLRERAADIDVGVRDKDGETSDADVEKIRGFDIGIDVAGMEVIDVDKEGQTYQQLSIPGIVAHNAKDTGEPMVPVHIFMQEIPWGAEVETEIVSVDEVMLKNINCLPVQKPAPDISGYEEVFIKDEDVYSKNAYFPEKYILSAEIFNMRDHRFLRLKIGLGKANPSKRELKAVSSIKVRVDIDYNSSRYNARPDIGSQSFDMLLSSEDDQRAADAYGSAPEKYMILMDDQFEGNAELDEFIDWKRLKGYDVEVVKTSEINSNGEPDSSEIQDYMLSLNDTEYPSYLLIIGDETADNGVDGWWRISIPSSASLYGYTDLYYTNRDTNQFPVPDLFYGRIPARDNSELSLILNKIVLMDRTPPVSDMYDNVTVAAMLQDSSAGFPPDPPDNIANRLFCETADAIACYFENITDYSCSRNFVNPHYVDSNCYWNSGSILWNYPISIGSRVWDTFLSGNAATNRIISDINNGISLLYHRDHGNYYGWGDPYFQSSHVNNLTNGDDLPLVYSLNCLTGGYHKTNNFTRRFLLNPNGGAYSVISAVDHSFSWINDWMAHGLMMGLLGDYQNFINTATVPQNGVDWSNNLPAPESVNMNGLVEGQARKLGQNLHFGKVYLMQKYSAHRTTFEIFHVFGDPEGDIVVHTPQALNVVHPSEISTGSQTVTVETDADSVQVALYSEALGIHSVAVTDNGVSQFNINPGSAGTIHVTVTGFGKRPYEGEITVGSNTVNQVFGFEDHTKWYFTVGSGTLSNNSTLTTQGSASLVYGGDGYREITSEDMNTEDITGETQTIGFDIYVGSNQPNPWWIGSVEFLVSCPSAGIYHQYIGNQNLTDLNQDAFNTVTYTLPGNVLSALQGSHNDFSIHIVLSTNPGSGPYLLDNMRFF